MDPGGPVETLTARFQGRHVKFAAFIVKAFAHLSKARVDVLTGRLGSGHAGFGVGQRLGGGVTFTLPSPIEGEC